MARVFKNLTELIGNTPLLQLTNYTRRHRLSVTIMAKLEYCNPAGSIKDRIAKEMIEDAERKGILKSDSVIIEPTSSNTGIGLASVAAARGYRVVLIMPENVSMERKNLLRAYGAELVLTDASLGMRGAIMKARQLSREIHNSFVPNQFTNSAILKAHSSNTGPEIWRDTDGAIDIFVCGVGTGGTIMGVGSYLKSKNPYIRIAAIEPYGSAVLSKGRAGPHKIQGIGMGFVPEILDSSIYDEVIKVKDEDAFETGRRLSKFEGLLVGMSSGATLWAATEIAKRPESRGKCIVVIFPDAGERFLSVSLTSD